MAGRGRPFQIEWHDSEGELYEHYRREKDSQRRMRLQAKLHSDNGELDTAAGLLEKALKAAPHDTANRRPLLQSHAKNAS